MTRFLTLCAGIAGVFAAALTALALGSASHAGGPNEPDRFLLRFTDAYLVHEPGGGNPQIVTEGNVLSYGQDWEIVQMRGFLYHMRQSNWEGFYWKVNTSRGEVYRVEGGTFGSLGGSEEVIESISVDPVGDPEDPTRFLLRFSDAYLVYVPGSDTLQITAAGNVLSYGGDWSVTQDDPWVYDMSQNVWQDFHWKVNTAREIAYRVTDETDPCLTDEQLEMGVDVVGGGSATLAYGCVWSAVERPEGEDYPQTNPLAGTAAENVVGKESYTATAPAAMVRVTALDTDASAQVSTSPALSLYGEYDLFLPAGTAGDVLFEITDAASGNTLHRTGPEPLSDGTNLRHLLVPAETAGSGSIAFPEGENTGLFTRVGFVELADIDAQGFAGFSGAPERLRDAPFGGSLRLFGAFTRNFYPETGPGDYCYKIRISEPGGATSYVGDGLNKTRYAVNASGDVMSRSEFLGPMSLGAVDDCYRLTPLSSDPAPGDPSDTIAVFWSYPDMLAHWHTRLRSGAHTVSLELYDTGSGNQVDLVANDNLDAELFLDNRPITLTFDTLNVVRRGTAETDLLDDRCAMARLMGNRELEVDFTAYHPTGFLSAYRLAARSNSGVQVWQEGDSYGAPAWSGTRPPAFEGRPDSASSFTKTSADFTAGPCAYVFDLWAAARTTNGYSRINRAHSQLFYFIEP